MTNARVPFFRNARRLRLRSCLRHSHFYLRAQHSSTYGRRTADHHLLMRGSLVEVHSSSYFCSSHARTVFSCGAPCCNPAHRGGMGSGG
jgi:hypothetical protein